MRRVRSKGKKLSASNHDDPTSDEEKIPTQKRRGRPQKTIKDEIEEEVAAAAEKAAEDEDSEETTNGGAKNNKESKTGSVAKQNGKKRKNNGDSKEEVVEYAKGENLGKIAGDENEEKSKQTRHRRKGKPCRAPEAVVECT